MELTFNRKHYFIILAFVVYLLILAFTFNTPTEIIDGFVKILVSPSVLVSDYFVVGSIGGAILNAAVVLLACMSIPYFYRKPLSGKLLAALFTMTGFAFLGKNILNIWLIILGVFIYTKYAKESFYNYISLSYFATALSPIVSVLLFQVNLSISIKIIFAVSVGLFTGFIFPVLAKHFVSFHKGYNLYNAGFTAGIIGMVYMALFRAYGFEIISYSTTLHGYNDVFRNYLFGFFIVMFLIGIYMSKDARNKFKKLHYETGVAGADFVKLYGFGIALINMAIVGTLASIYVLLIGGEINGPSIGGILTVAGFGAYGKHIKNTLPIMLGVYIAAYFKIWEPNSTSAILAALFGTTLAPIAGKFGPIFGMIAGFLHMAMVMNVGILHGGINLYNNGFSGGFIAAVMVPTIMAFKKNITDHN